MATKRGRRTTAEEDVELANLPSMESQAALPPLASASDLEQRAEQEIDEVLGEVGGAAQVRISRVNPETGGRAHVGTLPAEGFSLDTLLDSFGGGRYYLVVKVGRDERWRGFTEVDPSVPAKNPRAPKVVAGVVAAAGPSASPNVMEQMGAVMATMMQAQASGVTMMQQLMALQASTSAEMLKTLMAVLGSKKEADPIETLRAAAEIFHKGHPETPTGAGMDEMLKLFREGMELGRKVAGGADEPSWMGIVGEGVKGLSAVLSSQNGGRQDLAPSAPPVSGPVRHALPVPSPAAPAPAAPPPAAPAEALPVATIDRPWLVAAKSQLAQLRGFALTGVEPSAIVELISKTAPESVFEDFLQYYETDPATFAQRFKGDLPDIVQLGEWGDVFLAELGKLADDVVAASGEGGDEEGDETAPADSA